MKSNTFYHLLAAIATLAIASSSAIAQKAPAARPSLPAEVEALHSAALQKATPTVRRWISEQARLAVQGDAVADGLESSLRQSVTKRFTGQTTVESEIDMVTLVTFVEMVKTLSQTIEAGRKQVAQINAAMTSLRSLLKEMENDVARTQSMNDADKCAAPQCGGGFRKLSAAAAEVQRQAGDDVPVVAAEITTIGQLRERTAAVKAKLAALEARGMDLTNAMQVQLAQIEKLQEMISALMSKVDPNADYVIKTLK